MASPTKYVKGDWKAVCDSCGQRYLASELRKRWDGLMVCSKDYEPRHPQDFVKGRAEEQSVPWSRSESTDYQFEPIDYGKQFYDHVRSDLETFSRQVDYIRTFSENVSYIESVNISIQFSGILTDSTTNTDVFVISYNKNVNESVSISDSGSILMQDYVDITYFVSDYVGTAVSF